jgi:hypothetical protein
LLRHVEPNARALQAPELIDKLLITGPSALKQKRWEAPPLYGRDRDRWKLPDDLRPPPDDEACKGRKWPVLRDGPRKVRRSRGRIPADPMFYGGLNTRARGTGKARASRRAICL